MSLGAIVVFWRYRRSVAATTLLLAVLASDLLLALPWAVTPAGVAFDTLPREAMEPSVHVERLRQRLATLEQRLLTPGGARGNEVVAGPRARLWRIPIATGYSSVELRHVSQLLPRAGTGRLDARNLQRENVILDLFAVRFVLIASGVEEESLLRADPQRWREVERFSTSLVSDRQADEPAPGEIEYVVYENLRAQPRAWMAGELLPVSDGALEDALYQSTLRDSRAFDPAAVALVDQEGIGPRTYGRAPRSAAVESIVDGAIRIRASSAEGGFLILSEAYYEGWQARVDDGPLQPVIRTDFALQGIEVPPGDHVVTFEFFPRWRRLGSLLSAGGLAIVVLCSMLSVRLRP
jgi:hypothetical protein